MIISKRASVLGTAVVLAGVPLAALAQTSPPTPADPPPATQPSRAPTDPSTNPTITPAEPQRPASAPVDKSATKVNSLIGLAVFSSDGTKVGTVSSVSAEPDGMAKAIHFRTGGFLGFGSKLVAVPEGKFTKAGDNIQLGLTADEVSKLPELKEQM